MSEMIIRVAVRSDAEIIFTLIKELSVYEKLAHEVVTSADEIKQSLFGPSPVAHTLIAEWQGEPVGFCLYFYSFSTFVGRAGIYIEDIYVRETMLGKGIGKALLLEVVNIAKKQNCGRVEWSVLDWNEPSIQFYKSLGAQPLDEWTRFRLTAEQF